MKKNKKLYIILIVLIVALILCVTNFTINFIKLKDADILNIDCEGNNNCEKEEITNNQDNPKTGGSDNINNEQTNGTTSQDNGTISSNNVPSENGSFNVSDKEQVWHQETDINIFKVKTVAPGDSGNYSFIVNNNSTENANYKISFEEINIANANLTYKLKRNNNYIIGDSDNWVKYNDLNVSEKVLNNDNKDLYNIEGKWIDNNNDTDVGRVLGAKYTLKISLMAEGTEEKETAYDHLINPLTGDNIWFYIILALSSMIILILLVIRKRQKV